MSSIQSHRLGALRLLVVAVLAMMALSAAFPIRPARAQCPQAVAAGERVVRYAQEAYSYLSINQTYLGRLHDLMIDASYASNATCSQVTAALAQLASYGPTMVTRARLAFYTLIVVVASSVVALGLGAWACVSRCRRLAWRAWIASHRRWVVSSTGSHPASAGPTSGADPDRYPIYVAGLLIVVAVGLAGVTAFELLWRPGPFSVIALLNPQGLIGDYPTSVPPGSNVSLMVLIINHMNEPMLYRVSVAVVKASAPPAPSSLAGSIQNLTLYVVVPPGSNATAPLTFTAPAATGQYKLLLLLYYYNASTGLYYYSDLFNQLYFNVTS